MMTRSHSYFRLFFLSYDKIHGKCCECFVNFVKLCLHCRDLSPAHGRKAIFMPETAQYGLWLLGPRNCYFNWYRFISDQEQVAPRGIWMLTPCFLVKWRQLTLSHNYDIFYQWYSHGHVAVTDLYPLSLFWNKRRKSPAWFIRVPRSYLHFYWLEYLYRLNQTTLSVARGITSIPSWINNYFPYKVRNEMVYSLPNFNGANI